MEHTPFSSSRAAICGRVKPSGMVTFTVAAVGGVVGFGTWVVGGVVVGGGEVGARVGGGATVTGGVSPADGCVAGGDEDSGDETSGDDGGRVTTEEEPETADPGAEPSVPAGEQAAGSSIQTTAASSPENFFIINTSYVGPKADGRPCLKPTSCKTAVFMRSGPIPT